VWVAPVAVKQAFRAYATIVFLSATGCAVGLRDGADDGGAPGDAAAMPDATPDATSRDSAPHEDAVAPVDSPAPVDSGAADSGADDSGNADSGDAADSTTFQPMDSAIPDDAPFVEDGNLPPNVAAGSCDPYAWTASALTSMLVTGPDGGQMVATPPSNAIDGLHPTRWTTGVPQDNPNLYYQLDFGGYVWVSSLTIDDNYYAVTDYPQAFDVAAANDGVHFSDYRSLIDGGVSLPVDGGPSVVSVTFPRQATRFLRIQITSANQSAKWWSMEEVHVGCEVPDSGVIPDSGVADAPAPPILYDGSGVPPSTGVNPNRANWTATAWPNISTFTADQAFSNAFDDTSGGSPNLTTRWSDGMAMTGDEYFVLNLGRMVALTWLTLTSSAGTGVSDGARAWQLQFSTDGTTWTPGPEGVNGATNQAALAVTQIPLPPISAQYIRINQLGASGQWWSLYDITVYGQ
jgi:hypothetical protein